MLQREGCYLDPSGAGEATKGEATGEEPSPSVPLDCQAAKSPSVVQPEREDVLVEVQPGTVPTLGVLFDASTNCRN